MLKNTKIFTSLLFIMIQSAGMAQSYRGLSVVNDNLVWVSGSKGTVLRTENSGQTWDTLNPKDYSSKDFRDIHAWNSKHAVIMSAGDSSVLLETTDGGLTWKLIYHDFRKGSFFDAIDVRKNNIILVGDAVGHQNPYVVLIDKKRKTHTFSTHYLTKRENFWHFAQKSDTFTFFAASGSNVQWLNNNQFAFIPVGRDSSYFLLGKFSSKNHMKNMEDLKGQSRYLIFEEFSSMPFKKQKAGGAYSFLALDKKTMLSAGGSFYSPDSGHLASFYSINSGKTWLPSVSSVSGYRSGLAYHPKTKICISTGPNGTDYSKDQGVHWESTEIGGFNVCAFSKQYLWLAGSAKKGVRKIKITEHNQQ